MREAVGSVLIRCNVPHIRIRITAQCAVALFRHIRAGVVVTVIFCRKRLAICRRIDHHPVAVRDGRCVSRLAGTALIDRILQSLYCTVHALQDRSCLQRAVLCDHRHIVRAVEFSRCIRLILRIASIQSIVNLRSGSGRCQRDLRAGSHSSRLGICLRRRHCPLRCSAFRRFVERELRRVTVWISRNSRRLIGTEFVAASPVARQDNGILSLPAERELSVLTFPFPLILRIGNADPVFISALRRKELSVHIFDSGGAARHGDLPYCLSCRICDRISQCSPQLICRKPCAVELLRGVSGVCHHDIAACRKPCFSRDLPEGSPFRG